MLKEYNLQAILSFFLVTHLGHLTDVRYVSYLYHSVSKMTVETAVAVRQDVCIFEDDF